MPQPMPSEVTLPATLLGGRGWRVIDKPAGLAVHPGPRTPVSLELLLPFYTPGRPSPRPVHRLDRDTSGCLLLAERPAVHRVLAGAFAEGAVRKLYWAIVAHPPAADSGRIEAPLRKQSTAASGWRMVVDPGGKPAATGWQVLARLNDRALIAFMPETGRTHQVRVHATLIAPGAAIIGDPVYGQASAAGMMLHARALAFADPAGEGMQRAEAPVPERFRALGFDG